VVAIPARMIKSRRAKVWQIDSSEEWSLRRQMAKAL
jgi:hypothetical protein